MKILHTSDWHLGKALENISRIGEQKAFVDELCEIADREEVELVLIAGDVFDTYTPSTAAEALFYDAIDRLSLEGKRAVVVIAGNHDSPDRLCAASPLAYKNGIILLGYPGSDAGAYPVAGKDVKLAASGNGWLELEISGCPHHAVILTLPYPSESRLEELLSDEADEELLQQAYSDRIGSLLSGLSVHFREDTVNLIVSHLYLRDGKSSDSERQLGGALVVDPGALPHNAHFIALGHLHRPQRIKSAPSPAYYSGSPLAYSFSETDYSKLVFIVEAAPGAEAAVKEVYLNSGKPLKQWIARNGTEEALAWCREGRDGNAWVDLEIYTDRILTAEDQKALRELHPGIVNIRPRILREDEAASCYEGREGKRIEELFKDFYKYRMGMEAAGELLDTFLDVVNESTDDLEEAEPAGPLLGGEGIETQVS